MSYEDFLGDEARREHFVVVAAPREDGVAEDVYHVDRGRTGELAPATEPTDTPANQPFSADVLSGAGYQTDAIDPLTLATVPSVRGGDVVLGQRHGHLDGYRTRQWDGARVDVRHGGVSRDGRLAFADYGTVLRAEAASALVGLDEVQIQLRDPRERLETPALTRRWREVGSYALEWGASSEASLGTPAKLNVTGDLVAECWIRPTAVALQQHLMGWNGGTRRPWQLRIIPGGGLRFAWTDSGGTAHAHDTGALITAGRLYHLAALRVGADVVLVVYDEATATETVTTATAGGTPSAHSGATCLLSLAALPALGLATGEWRAWVPPADVDETLAIIRSRRDRLLTSAEITAQPYAYVCRFSAGTGTSLTDVGNGTAATGTISGTATWRPSLAPDALVGQRIRRGYGRLKRIEPIAVDAASLVYHVLGHLCDMTSIAVRAGGSSVTAGTSRATLIALLSNTPTAGTFDYCTLADGTWIKLGSAPSRPLQVDINGEATGSLVTAAGPVVERMLGQLGSDPLGGAEIDSAALSALAAYDVRILLEGEVTVREAVARALSSVGASGWVDREGVFTAATFNGTASGTVIGAIDQRDILSIEPLPVPPPVWEMVLSCDPRASVLALDQMASPPLGGSTEADFTIDRLHTTAERRAQTLTEHPRAQSLTVETALATRANATTEAARRLALFDGSSGIPRGYRIVAKFKPFMADLDFLRLITVSYYDLDAQGFVQSRLGLDETDFVVLGYRIDHTSPGSRGGEATRTATLTVWRED